MAHESVTFSWDWRKAVAAITYLASRHDEVTDFDKYKAAKLLFLADKYELVRNAAPILGDEYRALKLGPVPQRTLDLLHALVGDSDDYRGPGLSDLQSVVRLDTTHRYPRIVATGPIFIDHLSASERAALDHVIRMHGRKTFDELKALTHSMEAYRRAWVDRREETDNMVVMEYEDFFEEDSDAIDGAFEEMIEDFELRRAFPGIPGV